MASIVASLVPSFTLTTSFLASSSSSSHLFLKTLTLRSSSSSLRLSFAALPLRNLMARASLGLTNPADTETPKIAFAAKEVDVAEWKGDLLAVGVTENDVARGNDSRFENPVLNALDSKLGGLLAEASSEEDFTGKNGQSTVLRIAAGLGSKRVALVGLGKSASTAAAFKGFGEAVAAAAKSAQATHVAVALASSQGHSPESKLNTASAIACGTVLGTFEDNRYKSESKKPTPMLRSVDIIGLGKGAEEASKIASTYSDVFTAKILDAEQCKELKMGSYLGVAAASSNPPHFIHLCYKPPSGPVNVKLALVGKGLTFDSGGYNIKTGPGCLIELMKFDMGGSAAVFGAAKALGQIKPLGVEVHFIVAACENMISGTGMRPGDIVTASNGKTIEVNNTDAEGRLTLADALVYACNQGVEKIVDLATLTGACIVALGPSIAGVFTPSDDLAKEIFDASEVSGEKLWRMPLEESYWESMKSGVADMVNTGGRQGGAITAALFLKQFVDEKVQWMHIDLAGPVWNDKQRSATGFGVATLVEWVLRNAS
ncbi:leucine aminopeptidase 1-like isoform X2 [Gastrolobium bilobum]|uniref:leucine aminopeptidase 1-like isoform X2 n=1 Tax=Gastrolobium bilobum TaxID=150636 RepID=UPI002AAF772B|nr:leucine aminopeptidase 1-like isoform X2 [Gastrolobium bilobum]